MGAEKKQKYYAWYVVLISALIGVSMTAGFPQFTMVVKDFSMATGISEEFLLFTDTIKAVSIMGAMLVSGPLYKKLGLKKIFALAILSTLIPQVLMPYASGRVIILLLKIIQGFCAIIFPVFLITIMGWMDKASVGTATAVFNGIFYGGSGLGATLAGVAITNLGWKASFNVIALMTLLPAVIWFFTVKENDSHSDLENVEDGNLERKGESVFKVVAKSPQTWLLIVCLLSTIWMVQVLSVDLPLYGEHLSFTAAQIGLFMSSLTFGIFFACIISGRISDYFAGKARNRARARIMVFAAGPIMTILSTIVLMIIGKAGFTIFYAAVLLISFSSAWGLGSFYCILPEILDREKVEYSTGFIGGIADIGMPVGPLIVGVVFGAKGFWNLAWISCIIVAAISVLGSLLIIKIVKSKPKISA